MNNYRTNEVNFTSKYLKNEIVRINKANGTVIERWELLNSFRDMPDALFDIWKEGRQSKNRDRAMWKALGVQEHTVNPFEALGVTTNTQADETFVDGFRQNGSRREWKRMRRNGNDISPIVRIYCSPSAEEGKNEAKVFWQPDQIETCKEYNALMEDIRQALRELNAYLTLKAGL